MGSESCSCPPTTGWGEYESQCYFSSTLGVPGGVPLESVLNYNDAISRCQTLGGDLVLVKLAAEWNFIKSSL